MKNLKVEKISTLSGALNLIICTREKDPTGRYFYSCWSRLELCKLVILGQNPFDKWMELRVSSKVWFTIIWSSMEPWALFGADQTTGCNSYKPLPRFLLIAFLPVGHDIESLKKPGVEACFNCLLLDSKIDSRGHFCQYTFLFWRDYCQGIHQHPLK